MKALTMKTALNLEALAKRLTDDAMHRTDLVVPTRSIEMHPNLDVGFGKIEQPQPLTDTGHRQLGELTPIPAPYYDHMRATAPALLAENVNTWLGRVPTGDKRMVRILHDKVRAFMSTSYQRIDNDAVGNVALDVLLRMKGVRVVSADVTERNLYIKATSTAVVANDPGVRRVGDLIEAGVMVRNSEIGYGRVSIQPFAMFLACTNGMVRPGEGMAVAHIGRKVEHSFEGVLRDSTKRLEDAAILAKVRDVLTHAFDAQSFRRFIDGLTQTTQRQITGDIPAAIEVLGQAYSLSQGERSSVLDHLARGGDPTQYGVIQAVTRTAEDAGSYDRATELETIGGKLIDMDDATWKRIASAKPGKRQG
jgi:hypothetical protein